MGLLRWGRQPGGTRGGQRVVSITGTSWAGRDGGREAVLRGRGSAGQGAQRGSDMGVGGRCT